jgi:hypothetical protein
MNLSDFIRKLQDLTAIARQLSEIRQSIEKTTHTISAAEERQRLQ